jgi:signal transduction histidine kinase
LINLLANAIKFTEKSPKKKITLSLEYLAEGSGYIKLKIGIKVNFFVYVTHFQDTGVGMTKDEQAGLFQRFSQANVKTFHEYGGSGLGLFICRGLVTLMGGEISVNSQVLRLNIEVESEISTGTKFIFTVVCEKALNEVEVTSNFVSQVICRRY